MSEITPTPRAGSWLEITPPTHWQPQPRAGSWLEITPPTPSTPRRGHRNIGLVRGARG